MTDSQDGLKKCPFCAELIKEKATFCKHCHTDLRSHIEETPVDRAAPAVTIAPKATQKPQTSSLVPILAALVIVALCALAATTGLFPKLFQSNSAPAGDTQATTTQAPPVSEGDDTSGGQQEPETQPAQRTPVHLRDISYTVSNVAVTPSVGRSYSTENAQNGWTYLVVEYTVQNNASESKDLYSDDFVVTTDDGTIYEPDSKATHAISYKLSSQLHPGSSEARTLVYQVPQSALEKHPLMHIAKTEGGWSIASVPLTDWHGQVLFQPGSEHVGNEAPVVSGASTSELYLCDSDWSNSVRAFDCPAAAASWEKRKDSNYAGGKGLMRRCQFEPSKAEPLQILDREGAYVKVEAVDGMHKGRSGWIASKYLHPKQQQASTDTVEASATETGESPKEVQTSSQPDASTQSSEQPSERAQMVLDHFANMAKHDENANALAYQDFAAAWKARQSYEEFVSSNANGIWFVGDDARKAVQRDNLTDSDHAEVEIQMKYITNDDRTIRFYLVKEAGHWRIRKGVPL